MLKNSDKDYTPAFEKAAAVIVEAGGLTSHAAVVGIANGIPVIVGAKNVTSLVQDNELIAIDSRRGIIYRGATTTI